VILIAIIAHSIICERCRRNTTTRNTNPPLTQASIEKYMPAKLFSEVKNDVNCFLNSVF